MAPPFPLIPLLLAFSVSGASLASPASPDPNVRAAMQAASGCSDARSEAAPAPPEAISPLPEGIAVTMAAAGLIQRGVGSTVSALVLERLVLPTAVHTGTKVNLEPTLALVEAGTLAVIVDGRLQHPPGTPGLGPGEAVLVERGQLLMFRNAGTEPTSVLLLSVQPIIEDRTERPTSASRLAYLSFGAPPALWEPDGPERQEWDRVLLAVGEVGPQVPATKELRIACLHWGEASSEDLTVRSASPVGLFVLQGTAAINGADSVTAGECRLVPTGAETRVRAQGSSLDAVLFGALDAPGAAVPAGEGGAATAAAAIPPECPAVFPGVG